MNAADSEMDQIPLIRLNQLDQPDELQRLDAACRNWGFFELTDHGIPSTERTRVIDAMGRFFAQPMETKQQMSRNASNPWGFYDRELTKNTPDWKQIYDIGDAEDDGPLAGCVPQWPQNLAGFREIINRHRAHCERIAALLLQAIGTMLSDDAESIADAFSPSHTSFLRLNYYPLCSAPEAPAGVQVASQGHLGINHHTDAGALTVLMQDATDGLQVHQSGVWHTISPAADSLIINIGDVFQVWSNDRYQAPLHRVLANSDFERYSAAYFYNPAATAAYAPLGGTGIPRYRPIGWGEFRNARAAGDFANAGEEIQISHFRQ